jgi:basic membrane protein A and related proteins
MSKNFMLIFAILMMGSLLFAACAPAAPAAEEGILVCQITDTGGIDDKSFNATAWKGITDAQDELGIRGTYIESQEVADYEKNLNAFIEEGCDLIITVGFLIGDATAAAAEANPNNKFSIIDYAYDPSIPNVVGQVFNTDEAAFLAGYVEGVNYYNQVKGTNVEVLGYNIEDGSGLFSMDFSDQQKGRELAVSLMDEGADIILPVAGPVGLGAAAAIQERGNAYLIGVDSDWYLTAPEYGAFTLTSVMKKMDATTVAVIESVIDGTFTGGVVVGTLDNQGVDIAPWHDLSNLISAELQAEIDQLRADIVAGTIVLQ